MKESWDGNCCLGVAHIHDECMLNERMGGCLINAGVFAIGIEMQWD